MNTNANAGQYCELDSHWPTGDHSGSSDHGIQQTVHLARGRYLLIFDYRGRQHDVEAGSFTAKLKVDESSTEIVLVTKNSASVTAWQRASTTFEITGGNPNSTTLPITLRFDSSDARDSYGAHIDNIILVPLESAPDTLRVNNDFDEGRIDPVTHYAIPDCDDVEIALEAQRAHLDGTYTQYQRITDDLHQGWFGVNRKSFSNGTWDGGTVTIKKTDKIDSDTGHPESGQVRFYAKWGANAGQYCAVVPYDLQTLTPVNLVQGGINGQPGESVYGTNSHIPQDAAFYMEGVKPGKITLEWRFQKSGNDIRHEQTFVVATHQTVVEWKEEVRYQVRLQSKVATGTAVDLATYHTGGGFYSNTSHVQAIYYFYRQLFSQMPDKFMWAGMAKVAAAPIYAGMSDMTKWWLISELYPGHGFGQRDIGCEMFIKIFLLAGQKSIFEDMAWAHRAYQASGIWALNHVEAREDRTVTDFSAWRALDVAIADADTPAINNANGLFLEREQRIVIQPKYNTLTNDMWLRRPPLSVAVPVNANFLSNAGEWLSANSNMNPIPGGPPFRSPGSTVRLDVYADRWAWTSNTTNGMLQLWTGTSSAGPNQDPASRMRRCRLDMRHAAGYDSPLYSWDNVNLPTEDNPIP